jgi:YbbR domain-containing protein
MSVDSRESISPLATFFRILTHNGWLKIVSLIFAGLLFLIVRTQQVREFSRTARVTIHAADKVMVVGNPERVVDVTVKLPESLFSRQPSDEELSGELDLRTERLGKIRVRLSRDNFPLLDKRYSLVVHDPWLEVELDAVLRKKVAVKAVLQGLPKEGLDIERVVVSPAEVEIEGAQGEIEGLDFVSTSPINIENIDKTFSSLARLVLEDSSSVKFKEDKVNVQIAVGLRKSVRVFRSVPVEIQNGRRAELRPVAVQVEIQGEESYLQTLRVGEVRALVDADDLQPGWQDRKIRLKIPANTSLVRVTPDTVSLQELR